MTPIAVEDYHQKRRHQVVDDLIEEAIEPEQNLHREAESAEKETFLMIKVEKPENSHTESFSFSPACVESFSLPAGFCNLLF